VARSERRPRSAPPGAARLCAALSCAALLCAGWLQACTPGPGPSAPEPVPPPTPPPEQRLNLDDNETHRELARRFGRRIAPYPSPEAEARADASCRAAFGAEFQGFGVDALNGASQCRGPIHPEDPLARRYLERFCELRYGMAMRRFEADTATLVCGPRTP